MKREISPAFIAAALAGVLIVLSLVAWRFFGVSGPSSDTPETRAEAKRWVEAFKSQAQHPGQRPAAPGAGSLPVKAPDSTPK